MSRRLPTLIERLLCEISISLLDFDYSLAMSVLSKGGAVKLCSTGRHR